MCLDIKFILKFAFFSFIVSVRFANFSWADTKDVFWSTWRGHDHNGSATTPSSISLLKGLNAAGGSASALHADATIDDDVYDGDLIELGFFKLDDGSASSVAFKGVWTPITAKTTIGQNSMILTDPDGPTYTTYTNNAGEFDFQTTFSDGTLVGEPASSVVSTYLDSKNESSTPFFESDLGSSLSTNLTALDNASGSALLGIRFYDLNTGGDPSTPSANAAPSKVNGTTRYNTIMDANWVWQARDSATAINIMSLHDSDGSVNSSVQFEFDNTSAYSTDTSKIGTSDTRVENDDYVATVTYNDGSTALDLSNSGIGSTIVSGFDSASRVYGANDANLLTINSATGNDGTEAFLHSGDIYNASSGTNASDLTIIKTGGGTQVLTGNINLADSTSSGESAYVSIEGGSLEFDAASGKTQIIEYLKGSTGTLILDNTGRADQTLELGFAQTHSVANATFSGAVTLQGSNTRNTIKVSTGTTSNDYENEQVLSGVISGGELLVKDGVGILTLEGNNANTGGVEINNGTLKVGNSGNDADLGSGAVTINKGKLEVLAGDTIANQIGGGTDATKKSMLGGDGTFSYTTGDGIVVGSGSAEIDVISPGQGISSSLSETANLSNQQVTLGTSSAAEAMGNLTITSLTLNNGAIFDWEISDFNSGANQASFNDEFDVLNFQTLNFGSGAVIDVNIFSVQSNGTAGAVANIGTHSNDNGILFLNGGSHSDINWGSGNTALSNSGWSSASDYFSVDEQAFNYYNGNLMGDWNVWYNGSGDFYLRYTAAPEPSTYVMITGLLMLPGFRMFRRFFKKAKPENSSNDS